jgi:hypothetical protein
MFSIHELGALGHLFCVMCVNEEDNDHTHGLLHVKQSESPDP